MSSHTLVKGSDFNRANAEQAKIAAEAFPYAKNTYEAMRKAGWTERGPGGILFPPWMAPFNWTDVDIGTLEINGLHIKDNLREGLTNGQVDWTIEGASTVELQVQDPKRELVENGVGASASVLKLDNIAFALVKVAKRQNNFSLTFEDDIVNKLRKKIGYKRWQRGIYSRAAVIREMVLEVMPKQGAQDHIFIPGLNRQIPVELPKSIVEPKAEESPSEKAARRAYGIQPKAVNKKNEALTIKGAAASPAQIRVCGEVLQAGVDQGADKKCLVASIMCIIQESDAGKEANKNPTVEGVGAFSQIKADGWTASGNAKADAKEFFEKLIRNDVHFKFMTYGELINTVQGSANAELYNPWKAEATEIVNAFGRGQSFGTLSRQETKTVDKNYYFERKDEEDSWTCIQRLAAQVQWRAFVFRGVFFYVSEDELMRAGPVAQVSESDEDVDYIDWEIDTGEAFQTAKIVCREHYWSTPPGAMIEVTDEGPQQGRWLVYSVSRNMFSLNTEITINAPIKELPEPPPPTERVHLTKEPFNKGKGKETAGAVAAEMAENAYAKKNNYYYREARPMPSSLFGHAPVICDCSAFCILSYKAAGLPDPSGNKYNGSGFTGDMITNCEKVKEPLPGDFAFFGGSTSTTSHVNIVIGKGQSVSQGGPEGTGPIVGPSDQLGPSGEFLGYYRPKNQ
jgi:hypothetical protein